MPLAVIPIAMMPIMVIVDIMPAHRLVIAMLIAPGIVKLGVAFFVLSRLTAPFALYGTRKLTLS